MISCCMNKDYARSKKYMLILGIIFLIVGIVVILLGLTQFAGIFGTLGGSSFDDMAQGASHGFLSIIMFFLGGVLLIIGIGLIYVSQIRRVTSYVATEASPAITTATHAVGKGVASGINEAGGINMASQTKEVVKVKCPHCGYLESEDATFCSKCGKNL